MSIILSEEKNHTARRFPRSMAEAFPDVRSYWHTIPTRPSWWRRVMRWLRNR